MVKLPRLSQILQTGAIGGLISIPLLSYWLGYRASVILNPGSIVLLLMAWISSLFLSRSSSHSSERGFWGALIALLLFIFHVFSQVIMS